jgi:hypothetical protein
MITVRGRPPWSTGHAPLRNHAQLTASPPPRLGGLQAIGRGVPAPPRGAVICRLILRLGGGRELRALRRLLISWSRYLMQICLFLNPGAFYVRATSRFCLSRTSTYTCTWVHSPLSRHAMVTKVVSPPRRRVRPLRSSQSRDPFPRVMAGHDGGPRPTCRKQAIFTCIAPFPIEAIPARLA